MMTPDTWASSSCWMKTMRCVWMLQKAVSRPLVLDFFCWTIYCSQEWTAMLKYGNCPLSFFLVSCTLFVGFFDIVFHFTECSFFFLTPSHVSSLHSRWLDVLSFQIFQLCHLQKHRYLATLKDISVFFVRYTLVLKSKHCGLSTFSPVY